MAWLAVDSDGRECIYQFCPVRREQDGQFVPLYEYSMWLVIPKGIIKKILGKELTWKNNPVELKIKEE